MSYYIDIIDTASVETKLVIEQASASGIVLEWSGADTKDNVSIIGSNIRIDMLSRTDNDAAFINFFTGDEHRFLVQIKNSSDDSIVWQGYILPDQYSEPWKSVNFFVLFTATCGLGRLKGKYLPPDFYVQEKSLIQIICKCLNLTGLDIPVCFSPAIQNVVVKDWNAVYIDTETFVKSSKNMDAYSVLKTLLEDTLCVCYQADNVWYVEGINKRNVRIVEYEKYNTSTGEIIEVFNYNRLLKNITPLVDPYVTIIPPYNEITVIHEKVEPSLPDTLSKEVNDGWAVVTGVKGEIIASGWMGHNGFNAICIEPDYKSVVWSKAKFLGGGTNIDYPQDDTQFVSLKEKLYFYKGQKLKIEFEFDIVFLYETYRPVPDDMNLWRNPFKYEILFNDVVVYSNFRTDHTVKEDVIFNESANAQLVIEHILAEEILFDVRIYGPPGKVNTTFIYGIAMSSCKVGITGFSKTETETDLINGDFTIDKEIELTYGNDRSGASKGFRLAKLKEETTVFNSFEVPIFYGFVLNGKNYSVVQLDGANLIDENRYKVFREGTPLEILNVFYNFNDGEQMVVETSVLYSSGSFEVKKYAVDDVVDSRKHWEQWTDAIYKIENNSYVKTVANIYRRIFNEAHEKIDMQVLNAVKFNDIILFNYIYQKDFFVLNCTWNLDANKSDIVVGRSNYKDSGTDPGDENIPPIVLAGEDIYITEFQTEVNLLASAYDPDGYIASQIWTKITGGFGDVIVSPSQLETLLQNLTEDFYTYQIQVFDNDGASAIDTVNVIRLKVFNVTLELIDEVINTDVQNPSIYRRYKLVLTPNIQAGFVASFKGNFDLSALVSGTFGVNATAFYEIYKNGYSIEFNEVNRDSGRFPLVLNYVSTDEIFIDLNVNAVAGDFGSGDTGTATASVTIDEALLISGDGSFSGLPIIKDMTVSVSS